MKSGRAIWGGLGVVVMLAGMPSGVAVSAGAEVAVTQPGVGEAGPATGNVAGLPELLKGIHSARYKERETAMTSLLRLPASARSDIENALAKETDEEAINRLTMVAVHLMLKDPQFTPLEGQAGLLGITLHMEPLRMGDGDDVRTAIAVLDVKPGFPAYEILKAGDRIVAVEGRVMPLEYSIETFRTKVNNKQPGTFLNVTVLRDGQQFKAAVQVVGVGLQGDDGRNLFVKERDERTHYYLEHLKTGRKSEPLVVKDSTPPNVNIYNDFEIEDTP